MHDIFIIINLISVFLIDYKYLSYNIILNICILFGWILNKNCIAKEYERYVACTYDNDESKCIDEEVDHSLYFYINPLGTEWIGVILFIIILSLRYRYKYNFINITNPFFKTILLKILLVLINLWFACLLIPAINYNNKYNNIKQLTIYTTFYVIILVCSMYYIFIQVH